MCSYEVPKNIALVKYHSEWPQLFTEAAQEIKSILKKNCIELYHIGSTAIPSIYAKPIIDILVVAQNINMIESFNSEFEKLGYVCLGEYGIPGRRYYWKSKTKRTHNVHLFEKGSPEIARHLLFKDFLLTHEDYAQAYSLIKKSLAEVFPYNVENYVEGKSSFIQMINYKTDTAPSEQIGADDNIIIEPYNPVWPKLAEAEIKTIKLITNQLPHVSIEHLGSTAVPELSSKPIIDIFITLKSIKEATQWIKPLETLGYVFWDENPDKLHLRFFKGMPPFGMKRTHHIHIVESTNDTFEHRVLFRDILRQDPKVRHEYEILKVKLAQSYLTDRETYTNKKREFIEKVLRAHGYLKPIQ